MQWGSQTSRNPGKEYSGKGQFSSPKVEVCVSERFQVEETAWAKVLKEGHVWHVWVKIRRTNGWTEKSKMRVVTGARSHKAREAPVSILIFTLGEMESHRKVLNWKNDMIWLFLNRINMTAKLRIVCRGTKIEVATSQYVVVVKAVEEQE